nr:protein EARLY RESPONSIVE TO DEHYDRATION 15-like [Ipomoea batatas]
MATSTLNPNIPIFVSSAYRAVDFSDQWWPVGPHLLLSLVPRLLAPKCYAMWTDFDFDFDFHAGCGGTFDFSGFDFDRTDIDDSISLTSTRFFREWLAPTDPYLR